MDRQNANLEKGQRGHLIARLQEEGGVTTTVTERYMEPKILSTCDACHTAFVSAVVLINPPLGVAACVCLYKSRRLAHRTSRQKKAAIYKNASWILSVFGFLTSVFVFLLLYLFLQQADTNTYQHSRTTINPFLKQSETSLPEGTRSKARNQKLFQNDEPVSKNNTIQDVWGEHVDLMFARAAAAGQISPDIQL